MGAGFLYIVAVDPKLCKIGYSRAPRRRLSSLRCGSGVDMRLHRTFRTTDCRDSERKVHTLLAPFKARREWFEVDLGVAEAAVEHVLTGRPALPSFQLMASYVRRVAEACAGKYLDEDLWDDAQTLLAMICLDPEIDHHRFFPWEPLTFSPEEQVARHAHKIAGTRAGYADAARVSA